MCIDTEENWFGTAHGQILVFFLVICLPNDSDGVLTIRAISFCLFRQRRNIIIHYILGQKKKEIFRGMDTLSGPEVIKLFSCSTPLSMKFSLLINMNMQKIVGIFIFISRENFMLSKKEFAIVTNLRFISKANFMLS